MTRVLRFAAALAAIFAIVLAAEIYVMTQIAAGG